jgi:hypothetical protein
LQRPNASLDRKLTFGCGWTLGFFVCFLGMLAAGGGVPGALGGAALVGVVFGLLALRYGQEFLEGAVRWLGWW